MKIPFFSNNENEILLKEYELAQVAAFEIDRSAWNIIFLIEGSKLYIFHELISINSGLYFSLFTLISTLMSLLLYKMLNTTVYYIQEKFNRCKEIEKILGMNAHLRIESPISVLKPKSIIRILSLIIPIASFLLSLRKLYHSDLIAYFNFHQNLISCSFLFLIYSIFLILSCYQLWSPKK